MTTQEVAGKYVELLRQGKADEIHETLNSPDIISTEPESAAAMGLQTVVKGMDGIKEKSKVYQSMIETMHGGFISEPVVSNDYFSVAMGQDVTFKNGKRNNMTEIAVLGVKDGKIISETFYY